MCWSGLRSFFFNIRNKLLIKTLNFLIKESLSSAFESISSKIMEFSFLAAFSLLLWYARSSFLYYFSFLLIVFTVLYLYFLRGKVQLGIDKHYLIPRILGHRLDVPFYVYWGGLRRTFRVGRGTRSMLRAVAVVATRIPWRTCSFPRITCSILTVKSQL